MFHPPDLSDAANRAITASTAVVVAVAIGTLLAWRRALRRSDLRLAGPLVAIGLFLGYGYRVVTAASAGANIGGGLILLFGVGFVPAMLCVAVLQWRAGLRRS